VIGGAVFNDDGTHSSSMQLREIGVAMLPTFVELDSLVAPPSSLLRTHAVTLILAGVCQDRGVVIPIYVSRACPTRAARWSSIGRGHRTVSSCPA
jgi:hypothetical protein